MWRSHSTHLPGRPQHLLLPCVPKHIAADTTSRSLMPSSSSRSRICRLNGGSIPETSISATRKARIRPCCVRNENKQFKQSYEYQNEDCSNRRNRSHRNEGCKAPS